MRYEPQVQCSRLCPPNSTIYYYSFCIDANQSWNCVAASFTPAGIFCYKVNSKEISSAVLVTNIPIYNEHK